MPGIAGLGTSGRQEDGVTVLASNPDGYKRADGLLVLRGQLRHGPRSRRRRHRCAAGLNASGGKTHPANSGRLSTVRSAACRIIRTDPVASVANRETVIVGWRPPNGRRS